LIEEEEVGLVTLTGSRRGGSQHGFAGLITAVAFRRAQHAICLSISRSMLGHQVVEDLLAERGLDISYDTARAGCWSLVLDHAEAAAARL